jgi:hypothetical protein
VVIQPLLLASIEINCGSVSALRSETLLLTVANKTKKSYPFVDPVKNSVLRIRDVYPGSRIRLFSIPNPGSELSPSRILVKEFKYFNPKKSKKWFFSSKKYDPGCSSRIRMLTFSHPGSRIPDVGVKKAPNPGSRIRIRNTGKMFVVVSVELCWTPTLRGHAREAE